MNNLALNGGNQGGPPPSTEEVLDELLGPVSGSIILTTEELQGKMNPVPTKLSVAILETKPTTILFLQKKKMKMNPIKRYFLS